MGAAIAAARQGAKTLVIEQFNCLGGVATAGGHGHISVFSEWQGERRIVGGIAHEIADRCISVTHVALGSTCVMAQCMGTGEAAGTAAALSLRDGEPPRRLDVAKLQAVLRQNGAILSEEDIARANGSLD